jgi:hypothetical protein
MHFADKELIGIYSNLADIVVRIDSIMSGIWRSDCLRLGQLLPAQKA